jgi:dTDP-4-dehydrorhamnose 3,5-epimerase
MAATSPHSPGVEIQIPRCDGKSIGKVIQSPGSPDLIQGVKIHPASVHPDDRGYFLEVARSGQGLIAGYNAATTQVSSALSYPLTIKAFHYHRRQTDYWCPTMGMLQVALVDLRPRSATFGVRNTMYVGMLRPWQILIPPGVGHGYKVIGEQSALLVYVTDRFYDPDDEGRIPYNHPDIQYDWDFQYK